ncbi:MAG TPA: ectonucleotide pyrophosphatase/phosphodiesterase, partial [Bacteroidales bacterium]|nr:ectonucleotide pyrophosphatase/phosphodiesterase [Bacteroidales bacterium]
MKIKYYVGLGVALLLFSCKLYSQPTDAIEKEPYVIMLSMDGFRWDYPEKANTPNLDYIDQIGVRAQASIPCFPTKTFPNHYSMATGLYPDHHGIIFNKFYAPDLDRFYAIGNAEAVTDSSFYFGEPIWVTAEKQGVKSASYFWVGSEASHDGFYPTYYYNYDGSVPYE